jgi:MFS family permease
MTHALTYFRRFAGLDRPVKLLLVNSFLIAFTVFGGISSVLQNLYLLRLGHSLEFIGLYSAIALLVFSACCLPAGALSQRMGLRKTLVLGVVVITAGWMLILLSPSMPMDWQLPMLMAGNAIAAAGMALRFTSTMPLIAALTQPSERSHAFSANSIATTLGAIAGSLLAGLLPLLLGNTPGLALDQVSSLRWTLLISTFIVLLSAVPILMID